MLKKLFVNGSFSGYYFVDEVKEMYPNAVIIVSHTLVSVWVVGSLKTLPIC